MASAALPFHSYRLRSKKASQTRLLNCYAQQTPPEGRGPVFIQGSPGIRPFAEINLGPQRAGIEFQGYLYCVAGNGFYKVDSLGNATLIDNVAGGARVELARNPTQIAILIAPTLFIYNDSGSFIPVSDPDFIGASRMAVLDGYGGFVEPDSGRFFISAANDFSDFDALQFATAEGLPDNLVSIEANNREFVLFGSQSIELWGNTGAAGFPFERLANGYIENGCGAAYSTCNADNTVYYIDQDRIGRRLEGNVPKRITTEGVEQQWQEYSTISDAYACSYVHDGHWFVVWTFPTAGATWVFDINTGEWHERESYGEDHWRAQWVVKCFDKTLVGDTQSGDIGELHSTTYDEWEQVLLREATSGVVYADKDYVWHDRLELDLDVGHGTLIGQGSDPEIMLDISNDGGVTFRAMPNRLLGSLGQYRKLVHWDRLGRSQERVYRIRVSDPVPFTITAARLDTHL